ncbi:unnamed protein product [Caenorhabditis auriculariae]|uniref:DUF281 domain-containing protein n=1 Tax=Caenorhabditis auriculariae TaxID=2777116 RepID=A0A8S1HMN2_9PELO|nr:unnamed protein product [Caenorhabditis auriculariae]
MSLTTFVLLAISTTCVFPQRSCSSCSTPQHIFACNEYKTTYAVAPTVRCGNDGCQQLTVTCPTTPNSTLCFFSNGLRYLPQSKTANLKCDSGLFFTETDNKIVSGVACVRA